MGEHLVASARGDGLLDRSLSLLAAYFILIIGLIAQSTTYLNHDVAWVLYSSREILHGAVFGRDIVAANPPLIWWISLIPSAISEALHTPLIGTFRFFVLIVMSGSLFASDRLLCAGGVSGARRILFVTTAAYMMTIGVHRDYGQREHLAVALVLPYVLAIALRMRGAALPRGAASLIGAAAAIGIAFKPYFLLVPVALEGALLLRRRSSGVLRRPELVAAMAVFASYAIALLLLARPWLFEALPAIGKVYWAFEQPDSSTLVATGLQFTIPVMGLSLVLAFRSAEETLALALASAGFAVAALVQGKYYSYHVYPAFTFLLLALVQGIPIVLNPWRTAAIALAVLTFLLNVDGSIESLINRSDHGAFGKGVAGVSAFVDNHVPPHGSFLAMATHPYPGFPTALYAHRAWSSASNSDLFLPAVVRLREGTAPPDPQLLRFAETAAHDAMLRDISKGPQLVLIDKQPVRHAIGASRFDFLQFYMEDPRFREIWKAYEPLGESPVGYAAYARKAVAP